MPELVRTLILVAALYPALILGLFFFQRHFIYHPGDSKKADTSKAPYMDTITVTTQDGLTLESWYQAPAAGGKPVIVYFHGNGYGIEWRVPKAQHFMDAGYGLLLAEYRGYSGNPGKPTETRLYDDGRAHLDWLIEEMNIPAAQIILYGESLGSGVAVQMATEYDVQGVVLDVPFDSTLNVAKSRFWFVPFMDYLLLDQFHNHHKIAAIKAPLFIGLAGQDVVIPNHFGRALYNAAVQPKTLQVYAQSDHNNIHLHGFAEDALAFIKGL